MREPFLDMRHAAGAPPSKTQNANQNQAKSHERFDSSNTLVESRPSFAPACKNPPWTGPRWPPRCGPPPRSHGGPASCRAGAGGCMWPAYGWPRRTNVSTGAQVSARQTYIIRVFGGEVSGWCATRWRGWAGDDNKRTGEWSAETHACRPVKVNRNPPS